MPTITTHLEMERGERMNARACTELSHPRAPHKQTDRLDCIRKACHCNTANSSMEGNRNAEWYWTGKYRTEHCRGNSGSQKRDLSSTAGPTALSCEKHCRIFQDHSAWVCLKGTIRLTVLPDTMMGTLTQSHHHFLHTLRFTCSSPT